MAVALIVAAGRGERLGSNGPKALATVAGRPMLEWSVIALREVDAVDAIVVALPADRLDAAPAGVLAVAGGGTRSESVRAALAAAPGGEVVIVHDAARPLAAPVLFAEAVAELARGGADAVIAAAPVADTIKQVGAEGRTVELTLDRSRLWAVQTPQVFRREALERALAAPPELLAAATDDAWLVERQGGTVAVLSAPAENFKITTLLDLRLAELLLAERNVR
jgi:2-C-methyl-D-erythritol 4-phosphate cytidylyltransferase